MSRPVIVVVGAGPGVSGSVARRFADEGCDVGLLGADQTLLDELVGGPGGARCHRRPRPRRRDRRSGCHDGVTRMAEHTGRIDLLHFNPSAFREKDPLELTVAELLQDVALGVGALLTVVQAARPYMSAGHGSRHRQHGGRPARGTGRPRSGCRRPASATWCTPSTRRSSRRRHPRGVRDRARHPRRREGAFTPDRVAEAFRAAMPPGRVVLAHRGALLRADASGAAEAVEQEPGDQSTPTRAASSPHQMPVRTRRPVEAPSRASAGQADGQRGSGHGHRERAGPG